MSVAQNSNDALDATVCLPKPRCRPLPTKSAVVLPALHWLWRVTACSFPWQRPVPISSLLLAGTPIPPPLTVVAGPLFPQGPSHGAPFPSPICPRCPDPSASHSRLRSVINDSKENDKVAERSNSGDTRF